MRRSSNKEKTYTYFSVDGTAIVIAAGEDGITEDHISLLQSFHRVEQNNNRKAQRHQLSLERLIEDTEGQSAALKDVSMDIESDFFRQVEGKNLQDKLSAAWEQLLPTQKDLLMKVYVQKKALSSIAKDEGVAMQAIQGRLKRIERKLKKIFE